MPDDSGSGDNSTPSINIDTPNANIDIPTGGTDGNPPVGNDDSAGTADAGTPPTDNGTGGSSAVYSGDAGSPPTGGNAGTSGGE